jgi:hypothetical protein
MERLFSPCTRFHDLIESHGIREEFRFPPEGVQELNLDVSTDEFLSAESGFTFADLNAMLGNEDTVAWLTPHAAVVLADGRAHHYCYHLAGDVYKFRFSADGKYITALARSPEHLSEVCDVVLRLLAASVVHLVFLYKWSSLAGASINATSLAYLMEQCQSLKSLFLGNLEMDENHCLVLGAHSRPDLEIALSRCTLTSAGTRALAEVLGSNQGPTQLRSCGIENHVLAHWLRGNSRLKSLNPNISSNLEVGNRELLAIAGALKENKGLIELKLWHDFRVSDETWGAICDSLETHPTLEVLDLRRATSIDATTAPAVIPSRIQALVDMLKVNMSIHTILLESCYGEHELFRESVIPHLETNRSRPRVRVIQKTRPIVYRAKVLGRALLAVRTDPNLFWIFLSGNAEIVFQSTTAPTMCLPIPATAAAACANVTSVPPVGPDANEGLNPPTNDPLLLAVERAAIGS